MKSPRPVIFAGTIYMILGLLGIFTFTATAIYTPKEEFFSALSGNIPFLPPWLAIIVNLILIMIPGFTAIGIFWGKNWARVLFVFVAVLDLLLTLSLSLGIKVIIVKLLYNSIVAVCLFIPPSNTYFIKK